jgi:D-alanyl-D-alanine carboxypeptidase (penicillin-binding protein 5/6)
VSRDKGVPGRRSRLLAVGFVVLAVLVLGAGALAGVKLLRTPPPPRLHLGVATALAVAPGPAPSIPLPAAGSFDLVSTDAGQLADLAPDTVWPIGSVAKVMTALVVLEQKPLTGDDPGPTYTITAQDVAFYRQVVAEDGSSLFVSTGEQFSERQLLLALLLPSANNIADTLAVWVSSSQDAFATDLNSEAQTLGMAQTHFADASGYSPQTVSTAADLIKLAQAALANPVLAGLVATPSAVMPDGTTVQNLDTDLGSVPGWLGIKTGSTPQAGGCLLFAAQHAGPLGGSPEVRVVGAILGQVEAGGNLDQELAEALNGAAAAVKAAFQAYTTIDPSKLAPPSLLGTLRSPWGSSTQLQATFESGASAVEVRVGATLRLSGTEVSHLDPTAIKAGTVVAHLTGRIGGTTVATWSVTATGGLGQPSWGWLLTH